MIDLRGLNGGLYKRASADKGMGSAVEGMSVDGQEDEGREVAEEHGIVLREVYNDNNISASKFGKKKRDDWERMLTDIESGALQIIIVWESSRGSRKLSEWSRFLDLIEERGVLLHVISHDRTYDPRNPRDWELLAQDGVKSAAESNLISQRCKRGHAKARRLGRPQGGVPFGWRRVYDEKTGKMLTQEPEPAEQVLVKEIFDRLLEGDTTSTIARDFTRRMRLPEEYPQHVPLTRGARQWRHGSIKDVATNPVHIGMFREPSSGDLMPGNWDGAIEESLWWDVNALLTDPARTTTKPGKAKYLLTNIARCGVCDSRLSSRIKSSGVKLVCHSRNDDGSPKEPYRQCVTMRMDWVDAYIRDLIIERLCDDTLIARLTRQSNTEQRKARAQAAELKSELEGMWAKVAAREPGYSSSRVAQIEASWMPQIEQLEKKALEGLAAGAVLALGLRKRAEEAGIGKAELPAFMREVWEEIRMGGRRELVKTFTNSIKIHRTVSGRRVFDKRRVEVR